MKHQKLIVAMNGIGVGALFRDGRGAMSFQYLQSWLSRPIALDSQSSSFCKCRDLVYT